MESNGSANSLETTPLQWIELLNEFSLKSHKEKVTKKINSKQKRERLAFLGDAQLKACIAELFYSLKIERKNISQEVEIYLRNNTMRQFLQFGCRLRSGVFGSLNDHSVGTLFEALLALTKKYAPPFSFEQFVNRYIEWVDENCVQMLASIRNFQKEETERNELKQYTKSLYSTTEKETPNFIKFKFDVTDHDDDQWQPDLEKEETDNESEEEKEETLSQKPKFINLQADFTDFDEKSPTSMLTKQEDKEEKERNELKQYTPKLFPTTEKETTKITNFKVDFTDFDEKLPILKKEESSNIEIRELEGIAVKQNIALRQNEIQDLKESKRESLTTQLEIIRNPNPNDNSTRIVPSQTLLPINSTESEKLLHFDPVEVRWRSLTNIYYTEKFLPCCGKSLQTVTLIGKLYNNTKLGNYCNRTPYHRHFGKMEIPFSRKRGGGAGSHAVGKKPIWSCCGKFSNEPGCKPFDKP